MPVKLNTPASEVDTSDPQFAPMLKNLQANILKPHGRDNARHVFLRFTAPPAQVKQWIHSILAPMVTTAEQQLSTAPNTDGGLVTTVFLSAQGYKYLGFKTSGFASGAFRDGMKHQKDGLFDPLFDRDNKDPEPKKWEPGFQQEVHALVALADDRVARLDAETLKLTQSAAAVATVLTTEIGITLRRKNPKTGKNDPVEHFGYYDGISQPVFIKRDHDKVTDRAAWDPEALLSLVLVDDPLTNDADAFGSYLVYRKLAQDVAQFNESVKALAAAVKIPEDLAGAMVVGRFKDGTPVVQAKTPGMGDFNDFEFRQDREGLKCPFHAHIRKVNPRGTTPLTSPERERRHRIARRGIPYGAPLPGVANPDIPSDPDPKSPRGLLFMCFQADVGDQFEFIQRTWVDNEHFPTGVLTFGLLQKDTGDDPLIGQDRDEAQRWPKEWGKKDKKSFNFEGAVTLKGGEYFFAPSLPFLRSL